MFLDKHCIAAQAFLEYPQSLCSSCFPLIRSHNIQTAPLQSYAWSFLIAYQLGTGDFGSLSLSQLSLVYQVYGSTCLLFHVLLIPPISLLVPLSLLIPLH